MKPIWVVESFHEENGTKELIQTARDMGHICDEIGLEQSFQFPATKYKEDECLILVGSIQINDIARALLPNCKPLNWITKTNYSCRNYYSHLGDFLFNDQSVFTTWAEFKRQSWLFFKIFAKEAIIFIRPDSGDKSFTGQLLDLQDLPRFIERNQHLEPNELIVISTPKKILGEWRVLVTKYNNEIITHSTYQYQGQRTLIENTPKGALDKCKEIMARGYHPDSVYCIDIAADSDNNYWLLELTSFSAAGLYAMNKKKIVEKISAIAEMEHENETI